MYNVNEEKQGQIQFHLRVVWNCILYNIYGTILYFKWNCVGWEAKYVKINSHVVHLDKLKTRILRNSIQFPNVGRNKLGPEVIKLFSCSTQLSMKFSLLINVKMPTIVGILTCMRGKNNILGLTEP